MTSLAILLVLLSAFFHALWNFVAKQATGGATFVWLFSALEVFLFLPIVGYFLLVEKTSIDFTGVVFIVGSGALHLAYFLLLSKGYQVGDLSVVYPLARGVGPLIVVVAAVLVFGERPTMLALVGSVLICGGVFWLTGDPRRLRRSEALPGIAIAGLTGIAIASYTLWDSYAVSHLLIPPLLFQWGLGACRALLLTPYAVRHWEGVRNAWQQDKWKVVFVAIFSALAYILVLIALATSPVSYVAPMRVISTLVGVLMGARFLGEGESLRRLSAAAAMVLGVIALSAG